ncbi:MAG TPA: galactokinase family protein [Solirubrobacteraceae bacterium]|nr:galactokinase family protein [Solirubrobacteraceae bacterium]
MPDRRCRAFAPGRVNLVGEHTDYNQGLALPFAISQGVTVLADSAPTDTGDGSIRALATDLDESDIFSLDEPGPGEGWRAYVHGVVAELADAGHPAMPARLEITGRVPLGAGLSSSAALTVALALALLELPGEGGAAAMDRIAIAQLCSRVENRWAGAQTGLLDQLASLFGAAETALCIDFRSFEVEPVPLDSRGWRFVIADSGERHAHASSGYNERREECAEVCTLLGVDSLRSVGLNELETLPEPLQRRARHVLEENARVLAAVAALRAGQIETLASLLSASHASLRDQYQISTPAVEATVEKLLRAGAAGARLMGGGFGGSVLGLLEPGVAIPADCIEVSPGPGAHILPH